MTGRHSGSFSRHGMDGETLAPGQQTTVAEVLQRAGYRTALFGKAAPLTAPARSGGCPAAPSRPLFEISNARAD